MHPTLVITTEPGYWKRIIGLEIGVACIAALAVAQSIHSLRHSGDPDMATYMFIFAGVVLTLPLFLLLGRRRWAHRFDRHGVTLRNGRQFPWSGFQRIEPRYLRKLKMINNYDLVFQTGTASVYHRMAGNWAEVEPVLAQLAAGSNPFV
jgi:hypothetical protein